MDMQYKLVFLCLVSGLACLCNGEGTAHLEEVNAEELTHLLQDEKYILILFMKSEECTGSCSSIENLLLGIREELAEAVGAWVVRCHSPSHAEKFGIERTSDVVVFVRLGKSMLYTGTLDDEEEMLSYLIANKESNVLSLNDADFEHQTQASSGATTGDWLIVFSREDCGPCKRALVHVEAAAANLRGRKNVAEIIRENDAGVTTRRFGVTVFPTVILFRLGRLYRYPHSILGALALTAFAEDTFRNTKAEGIPKPKTLFDDVTQAVADWLRENPWRFLGAAAVTGAALLILVLLNSPPPQSWTRPTKKKKKT